MRDFRDEAHLDIGSRKIFAEEKGAVGQRIVEIGQRLRQFDIGCLIDRAAIQTEGAGIDLYHDRVHAGRHRIIEPLPIPFMRIRTGHWRQSTIAMPLDDMLRNRARFDDDPSLILDHRRFADWMQRLERGWRHHRYLMPLIGHQIIGQA